MQLHCVCILIVDRTSAQVKAFGDFRTSADKDAEDPDPAELMNTPHGSGHIMRHTKVLVSLEPTLLPFSALVHPEGRHNKNKLLYPA